VVFRVRFTRQPTADKDLVHDAHVVTGAKANMPIIVLTHIMLTVLYKQGSGRAREWDQGEIKEQGGFKVQEEGTS